MMTISDLKAGMFVAFPYSYDSIEPTNIVVASITQVYDDNVLVHFLHGYKSVGENIPKENIVAIGNPDGKGKIKGWTGKFDIIKPDNKYLK